MSEQRKHLGRGLEALLGGSKNLAEVSTPDATTGHSDLREIPVDQIQRGQFQPRIDMRNESLQELADSIKAQGVVQPIVVRPFSGEGDVKFEIIAGERRWRATQLAGLHTIPATIKSLSDVEAMAIGLIENIQRENLNPIEEARALQRLIEEFELTHQEAAQAVGRSRASVTNLLRLLELPDSLQQRLLQNEINMGHARALLGVSGKQQNDIAQKTIKGKLSVRATESLVRQAQQPKKTTTTPTIDRETQQLQNQLSDKLGAPVRINHKSNGKGEVVISYNSLDELDGILKHIK
ncbi:MAG: ParB/RepB/Spo0J family partition protein [Gammaproteobacteria bacterium]|nr:ParB/RepB/Spo0J family partition protein [Gammaproteobacteria bacterium]